MGNFTLCEFRFNEKESSKQAYSEKLIASEPLINCTGTNPAE